jgi:tRNA(Ile)-lysidine synthase
MLLRARREEVFRDRETAAMRERVLDLIHRHKMIRPGDRIAVACSGGADSTALLLLLHELAEPLGCILSVAHLNHGLRGAESDADQDFVQALAVRLGVPFYAGRADVASLARATRSNQESQGRERRYAFFRSLVEGGQVSRVAVGHTADDQAETVLCRLLRGSGTTGLSGIHPVVQGWIIRPLLGIRRSDLRQWLTARWEAWREDASNQDPRFLRNRIRQEVLPQLVALNPSLVDTLTRTGEVARGEEEFWREYLRPLLQNCIRLQNDRVVVDREALRRWPRAVARRVLRQALVHAAELPGECPRPEAASEGSNLLWDTTSPTSFGHVEQLLDWTLEPGSGKELELPRKIRAQRDFQHLILVRRGAALAEAATAYCYRVAVPSRVEVPRIGMAFEFQFAPLAAGQRGYNGFEAHILLDLKVSRRPLTLRNWQAGDCYQPRGYRKPRKLQDLFQRHRIARSERAGWPVLMAGDEVIWARGWPVGETYCPLPGSARALAIGEVPLGGKP